jgi:hypothetical protein
MGGTKDLDSSFTVLASWPPGALNFSEFIKKAWRHQEPREEVEQVGCAAEDRQYADGPALGMACMWL